MDKNSGDSAFQRLQQSGLIPSSCDSTPSIEDQPRPNDLIHVESTEGVRHEDAQILLDAQTLFAKGADGSCNLVVISMDNEGNQTEQMYTVQMETQVVGEAVVADLADQEDAVQALSTQTSVPLSAVTGTQETFTVGPHSDFASLVETASNVVQLQSAAMVQAMADGTVFEIERAKENETSKDADENVTDYVEDANIACQNTTRDKLLPSVMDRYKVEESPSHLTHIRDIDAFVASIKRCVDTTCECHKFHCPICPKDILKPTTQHKLKRHAQSHWKIRVDYEGMGIVRCYQDCHPLDSHFHCPRCSRIFTKRNTFIMHLNGKHNANVVDRPRAENNTTEKCTQKQEKSPPKPFHTVMAVIGPDTLDILASDAEKVLEECRRESGVSCTVSEHNYGILEGDLHTINLAYNVIKDHVDYIQEQRRSLSDVNDRSKMQRGSRGVRNDTELSCNVIGTDDHETDTPECGQPHLSNINSGIQRLDTGISDIPATFHESEPISNSSDAELAGSKVAVSKNHGCEMNNSGNVPSSNSIEILNSRAVEIVSPKRDIVVSDSSAQCSVKEKDLAPESPLLGERTAVVSTPEENLESNITEQNTEINLSLNLNKSRVVTEGKASATTELTSALERATRAKRLSVGPKKRGCKPKRRQQQISKSDADLDSKVITTSTGRCLNLRRKRSSYKDYQSRMDALVKPWNSKSEDTEIEESVVSKEDADEPWDEKSRKVALDDTPYEPDPKVKKVCGNDNGEATTVKRRRGRPRKTPVCVDTNVTALETGEKAACIPGPISSSVVEMLDSDVKPMTDTPVSAQDRYESTAKTICTSADLDKASETDIGNMSVKDIGFELNEKLENLSGGEVRNAVAKIVVENNAEIEENGIKLNGDVDKNENALTNSVLSQMVNNEFCSTESQLSRNSHEKLSTKSAVDQKSNLKHSKKNSNVSLDVIKDELTGDIQLSLSVSFPKKFSGQKKRYSKKREKKYACSLCDKVFRVCGHLSQHYRQIHGLKRAPRMKTVCDICGKEMRQKHLKIHIASVHENEKPFNCTICDKSFSTKSYLKYHMSTHKDAMERARPFLCSFCGRGFYKVSQLKDHINVHTDSRPYVCKICNKGFPYRSAVIKHATVHTQEKPYECTTCKKTFKSKDYLRNHQVCHEPRKYVCPHCKRVYSHRNSLLVHIQRCEANVNEVQDTEISPDASQTQCFMCGYCQEIFCDMEKVQEHLATHVKQESTSAEDLLETLANAEAITDEQVAELQLDSRIITNQVDNLLPQSTIIIQEDGTPIVVQGDSLPVDMIQIQDADTDVIHIENVLVPESENMEVQDNSPRTINA